MEYCVQIGEWAFCPMKLLLWHGDAKDSNVLAALAEMPDAIKVRETQESLKKIDWKRVALNPFQISRAGICVSRNCQLRCRYCSECSTECQKTELSNADIIAFVEDLMAKGVARSMLTGSTIELKVIFTGGGEPTYEFNKFKDLVLEIRRLGKENNISVSLDITTNGAYDIARVGFICDHFDSVMVSYDGLPEIQDYNRPSPHYKHTSHVVVQTIKEFSSRYKNLIVRTTILPKDISRLREMADHVFGSFGISITWSIFPVTPKGRGKYISNDDFDACDFYGAFTDALHYAEEKYGKVKMSSPLFSKYMNDFYCGSLGFLTRVAWLREDGRIVTCLEMGNDETVIGRVDHGVVSYKESCEDSLVKITQQKMKECCGCIAFPFCRGGCPADHRAYELNNGTGLSWACKQTIAYWNDLLHRLTLGQSGLEWQMVPAERICAKSVQFYTMEREPQ